MKKLKSILFTSIFIFSMLFTINSEVKTVAGNYEDENGCLVVWEYKTALFGLIKYDRKEVVFC